MYDYLKFQQSATKNIKSVCYLGISSMRSAGKICEILPPGRDDRISDTSQ